MNKNTPFAAPVADNDSAIKKLDAKNDSIMELAKSVFLAWEKLRIVYNLVLVAETILLGLLNSTVASFEFWLVAIPSGIGANICFLIGPAFETYVRWLGIQGNWIRYALFLSGLLFSSLLVIMFVASLGYQMNVNQ